MAVSVQRLTGIPVLVKYPCASSTTTAFYPGDLVQLSSGTLAIATAGNILGIVQDIHPADTVTQIEVDVIAGDGSLFMVKAASTVAQADFGVEAAVTFTPGAHYITQQSSGDFIPLGSISAIGTSGGFEFGVFKAASLKAFTA